MADIFTAVRLTLDGTGFEAQATALATKSGQNAGQQMSQQITSKLKSAAAAGIGMAAGAVVGMALNGANQLDAATKQLQADTGMTAAEAKNAEHALAGMYRNNLQGFDEIGATMAVVRNALGLTGDAADALTERFLKYATATKQDASVASNDFHEILAAFNLTAEQTPAIMDKLIVSHQKYGTVITEDQAALVAMAPALDAMNMGVDDGIALLNLFQTAGISASKAPMALAKAMKELKPGQNINDLIAQISSIEDPTLRAQKAIEIFGVRGGVQLAQAFKPGITSLDQFKISANDAAGATDTAAAAIESGFGEKFKLYMKNAEGTLAEFGTSFNDLIGLASLFGPKFTTALLAGLGGIGGLLATNVVPQLAGALTSNVAPWMTAGTKAAAIFGSGMTMALPLIAAAAVVAAWAIINDGLNKQADALQAKTTEWAKTATVEQLKAQKEAIAKGMQSILQMGAVGSLLYGDQLASLQRDADVVNAQIAATMATGSIGAGSEFGRGVVTGIRAETPKALAASKDLGYNVLSGFLGPLQFSADKVVAIFGGSMAAIIAASKATGAEGMEAMAKGIQDARAKPVDAFKTMVDMLKNAMSPSQEAARLAGELTSKELAAGLRSADPAVRAQAIAVREEILSRLGSLRDATGSIGKVAMDQLRAGIKSKDPLIRQTAHETMVILMSGLAQRASQATPEGRAAMAALVVGIKDKDPEIRAAATAAMKVATDALAAGAPAARTAGQGVGWAFIAGMTGVVSAQTGFVTGSIKLPAPPAPKSAASSGRRAFALGTPYVPFDQLALVHRGEIVVPAAQSDAIRSGQATLGRGGDTFSPTVHVNVSPGSDVSPGAARRFGQAIADEVANVLQEQNARFTSRLRVARA